MHTHRQKTTKEKITVMLAEDHALVRQGFVAILSREPNFEVTGEAANGRELIGLLKVAPPDVVLLDIDMPVMNGKETLDVIKKRFPEVKVIMLTMHAGPSYMNEFLSRGASGFLSKTCDPDLLTATIETLAFCEENARPGLIKGAKDPLKENPTDQPDALALTEREIDILKHVCDGKMNREIGDAFSISQNTVEFHRRNIYSKTRSKSVADLVKYAVKNGIITIA